MSTLAGFFKESDTQLGVFYPKHYLIAAFRNLEDAQKAAHSVHIAGFPLDEVMAIRSSEVIELVKDEASVWGLLLQELSRMFKTEEVYTDQDLELARMGAGFVAVHCPTVALKHSAWAALTAEAPLTARYYGHDGIEHLAGDFDTN